MPNSAQQLEQLNKLVQAVEFERALALIKKWDIPKEDTLEARHLRCLVSDVYDYFGRYADSQAVIAQDGKQIVKRLADIARFTWKLHLDERKTYKIDVWAAYMSAYGLYRANKYVPAMETFQLCKDVLIKHVVAPDFPCHGTLSRVYYGLGLIHRQRHEYRLAKQNFSQSIDCAWQDIQIRRHQPNAHVALAEYRLAKSLALGLGWVCYTEGFLHLARAQVSAARALLANKPERIIKAYVDVVYACVQMSANGDQMTCLQDAIKLLQDAHKVFEDASHDAYQMRADNELALAHLRLGLVDETAREGEFQKAEKYARAVIVASEGKDDRWHCNALIVLSRVYRHQGKPQQAREVAQKASDLGHALEFSKIDALIALGEADVELEETAQAAAHFGRALEIGGSNPKVAAVCHLHLARAYALGRDIAKASSHVGQWRSLRDGTENAFIRGFANSVEAEVSSLQSDFTVSFQDPSIRPKDEVTRFHGWLTDWARERVGPGGSDLDAAKLLEIAPATFFAWRKDANLPKHRQSQTPQKRSRAAGTGGS